MNKFFALSLLVVMSFVAITPAFAVNYSQRDFKVNPVEELGFQNYDVATVTKDTSAFETAALTFTGFYANFARIYNSSTINASVKINGKDAFTVPAGSSFNVTYSGITSVAVKAAETGTTTVEVSVWGRTDLDV